MTRRHEPAGGFIGGRSAALTLLSAGVIFLSVLCGCRSLTPTPAEAAQPAAAKQEAAAPAPTPPTGNSESYYDALRAALAELNDDPEKAIMFLERAREADPDSYSLAADLIRLRMENDDAKKALEMARDLAARHPESAEAQFLLGIALARIKDTEGSVKALARAIELNPDDKSVYVVLVEVCRRNERPELAEKALDALAAKSPGAALPRFFLGEIYSEKKDWDRALLYFKKAAELDPELETPALRESLKVYQAAGRTDDLIAAFKGILAKDPDDTEAAFGLAQAYLTAKDVEKARAVLDGIIKASDNDISAIRTAGLLYYSAGRPEEAMKLFADLAKRPDASPEDIYLAAAALEYAGKKDEALAAYRKVPQGGRFYANAKVSVAGLTKKPEDLAEAEKAVDQAARKGEAEPALYISLAGVYEEAKDFGKAEAVLKKALTEHENDPHLLFRLAVTYDRGGKKEDAIALLKKVIEMEPDNPEALNYLGYTWADMGVNLPEAKKLIERALAKKPGDAFITDSLAWVYFKMGDFKKALSLLEKAVESVPDEPTILEHLGDAQKAVGDRKKALETYKRALPKQNDPEAKKGLEKKIGDLEKAEPAKP